MKKLVIFVNSLKRDGAERVSVNLARYMNSQGVHTILLTEWISQNEYEVPNGVTRISLNIKGNKYLKYLFNIAKMRKILKDIKPDTILIMDLPGCLLGIPASKGLRIKTIVSERNDPTHFPGKHIVASVSRWLMSKANGFVFQTQEAKEYYNKITKNKGIIIPNPLFIETMPLPYEGERKKVIVTAGRLTEQKNQKMLIEAFSIFNKSIPGYDLVIYGEGHLKEKLQQQAIQLKIERHVFFPGNKKDLLNRIKDNSLFVMTSDFEGMPNALLEAMAIGLPVISTDCSCGGPRAIINNGVNGILIPVGDSETCAEKMKQILSEPLLSKSLGKNAILIRKKLESKNICKKWKIYLESI